MGPSLGVVEGWCLKKKKNYVGSEVVVPKNQTLRASRGAGLCSCPVVRCDPSGGQWDESG